MTTRVPLLEVEQAMCWRKLPAMPRDGLAAYSHSGAQQESGA